MPPLPTRSWEPAPRGPTPPPRSSSTRRSPSSVILIPSPPRDPSRPGRKSMTKTTRPRRPKRTTSRPGRKKMTRARARPRTSPRPSPRSARRASRSRTTMTRSSLLHMSQSRVTLGLRVMLATSREITGTSPAAVLHLGLSRGGRGVVVGWGGWAPVQRMPSNGNVCCTPDARFR